MELSKNDQLLMGHNQIPTILDNSPYDQVIQLDNDSDSMSDGASSPRPMFGNGRKVGLDNYDLKNNIPIKTYNDDLYNNSPGASPGNFSPRPNNAYFPSTGVSNPELAKLFGLISEFKPQPIELSPHFKPFLSDLIPAIGSIDAFIKIPRPDEETEQLGLVILDEPTIGCSDPQIMKMQLREKYGIVTGNEGDGYVGFIKDLEHNQKALDTFLESYEEMCRNRPAPSMVYSSQMPDLEELMAEWPEELEKALSSIPVPPSDVDLSLEEYAKVICAMLDIPVKGNMVESLHLLFTLYQIFDENHHFHPNLRGSTPVKNW